MTLAINDREFQKALTEYAAGSSREIVDVLNKDAKDIGLTAARVAKRAKKEQIDRLSTQWKSGDRMWVKFIAKLMAADPTAGANVKLGKRKVKALQYLAMVGHGKTAMAAMRQMRAQAISKRILGARKSAIGFIAHAFTMAGRLADPKSATGMPRGRGKYKAKGWATPANIGQGDRPVARLMMAYEVKNKAGATAVADKALQQAVRLETADMKAHIIERLQRVANRHQGKKRR